MPKLLLKSERSARITSYFNRKAVSSRHSAAAKSDVSLSSTSAHIPGLTIYRNFITPAQESDILAFLDTESWRTDLQRRCIHYGGTYCLLHDSETTIQAPPLPSALTFLVDRFVEDGIYKAAHRPGYCIVNEYIAAQGISAHVENFRFGEPVCGITLAGAGWMRFHELAAEHDGSVRSGRSREAVRTGRVENVWLERRSCLVMNGVARRQWQHEILRTKKDRGSAWRRVSLTFRVDK